MKIVTHLFALNEDKREFTQRDVDEFTWHISSGNTIIVKDWIRQGIDVNAKDSSNLQAPLMWASSYGKIDIVKELLNSPNILIDLQEQNGYTALMHACSWGNLEIVKLLLNHGAKVNIKNRFGQTAYDVAKTPEIKRYLIHYLENDEDEI